MRRVRTESQVAALPSGALIELLQPISGDQPQPEYASAELVRIGRVTAVTATADGLTTGLIPADADIVEITSADAAHQVSLPAAQDGKVLRLHCPSTGCEVISAVAADKLNNVVVGATNEAALVAATLYTLRYVGSAGNWVMTGLTALGAVETPVVPDAL